MKKLIEYTIMTAGPMNEEKRRERIGELVEMRTSRYEAMRELKKEIEGDKLDLLTRIWKKSDWMDEDDKSLDNLEELEKEVYASEPELSKALKTIEEMENKTESEMRNIPMDTVMVVESRIPNQITHPIKLIEGNYYKMDFGRGPWISIYTGLDGGLTHDPTHMTDLLTFRSVEDEGEWYETAFLDGKDTIGAIDLGPNRPSQKDLDKISAEHARIAIEIYNKKQNSKQIKGPLFKLLEGLKKD